MGICRRVCGDEAREEDARQATADPTFFSDLAGAASSRATSTCYNSVDIVLQAAARFVNPAGSLPANRRGRGRRVRVRQSARGPVRRTRQSFRFRPPAFSAPGSDDREYRVAGDARGAVPSRQPAPTGTDRRSLARSLGTHGISALTFWNTPAFPAGIVGSFESLRGYLAFLRQGRNRHFPREKLKRSLVDVARCR